MSPFRRSSRRASVVPPGVIEALEAYGRSQVDPQGGHLDAYGGQFEYDAWQAAQGARDAFIHEVSAAGLERGEWATYGAHRFIASVVGPDVKDPEYVDVLDAAVDFLQSTGNWSQWASPLEARRLAER